MVMFSVLYCRKYTTNIVIQILTLLDNHDILTSLSIWSQGSIKEEAQDTIQVLLCYEIEYVTSWSLLF